MNQKTFTSYMLCLLVISYKQKERALTFDDFRARSKKTMDTIPMKINRKTTISYLADSVALADSSYKGLKTIDSLILLYPDNENLYLARGSWYYYRQSYNHALSEFETAESVDGHLFPTLSEKIGLTYLKLKETDKALAYFREAAQYSSRFNYYIAKVHEMNNLTDSALFYYTVYYQKNRNDSTIKRHIDSLTNLQGAGK
jgi:tetratricopeptide (TPR) repeat protein